MHAVGGTPFQRHHRRIAIAIAIHVDLAAQARNQGIADLVDAQPRVACQQPRGIDGFAGGEAAAGSGRHTVGNAPVAAAIDVARRRLVGGWRTCRRSEAALGVGEVRIGPAHALEAAHTELAAHRRHTKQCAEGASFIGPAAHEGAARGGLFAGAVPVGLGLIGDVHTGAVERACAAHVHHTGDAAFEHARGGCLAHGELGKEFGGKQIQIDFAVLVLRIQADRGGGDAGAVERGLGEAGAQAADGDVEAFAVDVARQVHARNTVERLGNVHVRKLADIFGKHRVGKAHRIVLGIGGKLDAASVAGDSNSVELFHCIVVAGTGWRRLRSAGGIGGLCPSGGAGHAQQNGSQRAGQRGSCVAVLHRNPFPNR